MDTIKRDLQGIQPEFMITITYKLDVGIKPRLQFTSSGFKLKNKLKLSTDFLIIPEFTDQGQIHYHGCIKITDKIKFYKSTLPWIKINCGYVVIKRITNLEYVFNYITKEYNNNVLIIGHPDIVVTNKSHNISISPVTTLQKLILIDSEID